MITIKKAFRGISKEKNIWVYGMPISENLIVQHGEYGITGKEHIIEIYSETLQRKCKFDEFNEDIFEGDKLVAISKYGFKIYGTVFLALSYIQNEELSEPKNIAYVRISEVFNSTGTLIFKDNKGDMFIPLYTFLQNHEVKIIGTVWDDYLKKGVRMTQEKRKENVSNETGEA